MSDILNPRRAPRVPLRCGVEVRHGFLRWTAQTEDLGPGGCQLATPRLVVPGREVKLAIRCDPLGRTIEASGKVAWARPGAPARLGVAFDRGTERGWYEALLRSDALADRAARSVPDRLPARAQVWLGEPPTLVVDFSPLELELLRRVGPGVRLGDLARSFGPELDDRTRGAIFSLVARRLLVLDAGAAVAVARWRGVLPDEEEVPETAARDAAAPAAAPRPDAVQRLYEEALQHVRAGRLGLAVERLRDALRLAPADEALAAVVQRVERFAWFGDSPVVNLRSP